MKLIKELLKNSDITYDVTPSGSGSMMMEIQEGFVVVTEFDSDFDEITISDQYILNYNNEGWNWKTLVDEKSKVLVNNFIIENNLTKLYMDEVYEAVSQTF